MQSNYFTLRALASEWHSLLSGALFREAYSTSRGEVTLVLEAETGVLPLRVGTAAPDIYAFLASSSGRPRRNATSFFSAIQDAIVERVVPADLDRHVFVHFRTGAVLQLVLFGTRANVLLVGTDGIVIEAFRASDRVVGLPAPEPRRAPMPSTAFELEAAIGRHSDEGINAQAIRRAIPILDANLARELAHRFAAERADDADARFDIWQRLHGELVSPSPRIVSDGNKDWFSLIPLEHTSDARAFESVNDGVSAFVRRNLGRRSFENRYAPLVKSIERMAAAANARVEAMADELARPSRADEYERAGHLLMALPNAPAGGVDRIGIPDLFEGGTMVIELDPELSHVENALRYYDRAKSVRQRREAAEARFDGEVDTAGRWARIREQVLGITTTAELETFEKEHSAALSTLRSRSGSQEARPYREIEIGGFQVLIGKSARHNDALTFGVARKHDLWMHARGVPGSHVVVRVNRGQVVPKPVLEQIAAVAAWHSKARGSGLVPVIVAERKHVRKVKGGRPGSVIVERERVLTIPPADPSR